MRDFETTKAEFLDWISNAGLDELKAFFNALEARLGVISPVPFYEPSYSVVLESSMTHEEGGNRLGLIKEIRGETRWGLKESKDAAEGHNVVISSGLTFKQAEALKAKLEPHGAIIHIVGDKPS